MCSSAKMVISLLFNVALSVFCFKIDKNSLNWSLDLQYINKCFSHNASLIKRIAIRIETRIVHLFVSGLGFSGLDKGS